MRQPQSVASVLRLERAAAGACCGWSVLRLVFDTAVLQAGEKCRFVADWLLLRHRHLEETLPLAVGGA